MEKLIILTDSRSDFLISIADLKNYTSMDIKKIQEYFEDNHFEVDIKYFSDLDLSKNYKGQFILYQSSESFGSFYKRYIEDLIFFLEKQGAITLPKFEYLKAHHNKVFMEMMRINFLDNSLKTITSRCFGSGHDALDYTPVFPVVIKQASGSASKGVFLARNSKEYVKYIMQKLI
jgi:glutathione synthase/RimK-type ligase-like ATP-grasp enzyme